MVEKPASNIELVPVGDDQVVPFHVEELEVRGRAIQTGPLVNSILDGHDYPEPVSFLLAELVSLTILLGSSLKFDGKFIIQTESDGPVPFLVADFTSPDAIRAYARYEEDQLQKAVAEGKTTPTDLMGKGVLAMTIDQGANTQRYQGIVSLDGRSLEEIADQYFRQSEQIPTKVKLGVAQLVMPRKDGGSEKTWRAGGLIAQFLPQAPERMRMRDLPGGDNPDPEAVEIEEVDPDDQWVEAESLVSTIEQDELTDPGIGVELLLYRLFHERGVHVHPSTAVFHKCGCSHEKVVNVIRSFSEEEKNEAFEASDKNGLILSKCEFCGSTYEISAEELED